MVGQAEVCGVLPGGGEDLRCPVCGRAGKRVSSVTVNALVRDELVPLVTDGYALCLSRDCDVVYFGREIFHKKDIKVPVWYKETGGQVPVCYCKGVTVSEIEEHILRGCCSSLEDIQRHTGANTGKECLTKNPAGT